jgi:arylsulfatase A-like enzyme
MFLRQALSAAASGAVLGLSACARQQRLAERLSARPPNILLILADDLGYGDLGCYGQQRIHTPHLDRMAAEGLRFTQHYAGSAVCAPSRCSLMTGLHTGHARIRGNDRRPLLPEDVTVAERLREAGYATGIIGKWGLGEADSTGIPTRQGFDYFFGYLNQTHAHNYYPEFLWRNEQKVPLPNRVERPAGRPNHPGGISTNRAVYSHDLFVEEAEQFIRKNASRPFFLYLALTIPHANNEAGQKGMEVPDYGPYAGQDWPEPQKGYAAMITRMDEGIGRLFAVLKELGIEEETVVFFSSDNGPHQEGGADPTFFQSSGPLRGIKRDLYEGGIRVPMLVRWPGVIAPGRRTEHVSAFWDFYPTCLELAGLEPENHLDGISFLPVLLGEEKRQKEHSYLYWELHEALGKQALRAGRWKAVRQNLALDANAPIELYDLKMDPMETRDVSGEYPHITEKMKRLFRKVRTEAAGYQFGAERISLDSAG